MRRYVDLGGKLKFDSLILKKQAISEENKLKKFILSAENHSAADFDESETGLDKLKQAMRYIQIQFSRLISITLTFFFFPRHSAFNLRKKYEQAKERAQRTEAEVKSTMEDIAEHIQVRVNMFYTPSMFPCSSFDYLCLPGLSPQYSVLSSKGDGIEPAAFPWKCR